MAVYDIIPTSNVTFNDIRDTLNAGNGSVNNEVASAFKATSGINKWSKHKPVVKKTNFCQDFNTGMPNYVSEWWRGDKGECGMQINNIDMKPNLYPFSVSNPAWEYIIPAGGEAEPLRLGDFVGYCSNTNEYKGTNISMEAPFKLVIPEEADNAHPFRMSMQFCINGNNLLGLKDILKNTMGSTTLGVVIKSDNSDYLIKTTDYLSTFNGNLNDYEFNIESPVNFPTIFKSVESKITIVPFIALNFKQTTETLNGQMPSVFRSLRCLDSYPEYYTCKILPYVPPKKFTVKGRYVLTPSGSNSMKVDYYLSANITSADQPGGTMDFQIMWTNPSNITGASSFPIKESGTLSIQAGSPVGSKKEILANTQYFDMNVNTNSFRVQVVVNDTSAGYVGNVEWQDYVEWER